MLHSCLLDECNGAHDGSNAFDGKWRKLPRHDVHILYSYVPYGKRDQHFTRCNTLRTEAALL